MKPNKASKKQQQKTVYKWREWEKIANYIGTKTPQQCMKEYEKLLGVSDQQDGEYKAVTQTKRPN